MDLTKQLLSIDQDIVKCNIIEDDIIKKVREKEPTISKLTPDHFLQIKPDISPDGLGLLEKLCSPFKSLKL